MPGFFVLVDSNYNLNEVMKLQLDFYHGEEGGGATSRER
jgi:hypothetical protein